MSKRQLAVKADLFQTIRTLVPGLDEEQYTQLEAILALAGVQESEAPLPDMPEPPEGDEPTEDMMAKAIQRAMKKLGIDPDQMSTGSIMTPRPVSRQSRVKSIPPYEFMDGKDDDKRVDATKATYQIRYGTPDAAVKTVLTDLYGNNFEEKRWFQWKAFNRYLRRPDRQPDAADMKALSEVIITPDLAAKAIQMGIEVSALKDTMLESVDSLGGVVVPVDFQTRVIERLQGMVIMRGRASVESTSRDKIEFPVAKDGNSQFTSAVRVTWVDETPTAGASDTNLTFGLESIPVHTVMAETPLSRNLIEDAAFDLAGYLSRKFAEASAVDEDNRFLTGDGNGKPQGILPNNLNSLGLKEVNSGAAADLTWDGLINLSFGPDSQYRGNAIWMAAKNTYASIATQKNGLGDYLWRRDNTQGQPQQLMGYNTAEQEALPAVGAGKFPIIFGDPTGYTIVDRVGATIERYLDSATARQNMVYYVMRRRVGGQVTEPWKFAVQKVSA
jgi:HK97 family phage major capsid protein